MFQGHSNVKLQLAATFCISNLIWNEEDGEKLMTHGFCGGAVGDSLTVVLSVCPNIKTCTTRCTVKSQLGLSVKILIMIHLCAVFKLFYIIYI